ncbi:pentapeptide repeat-containing protein [Streptomyces sp. NPDC056069]|uniref:pentapeptide repeat-containing protein n=1 Tax=Streptomyces sp. NPDC056069 TaxID=3345702 RepID=UPI0035D81A64
MRNAAMRRMDRAARRRAAGRRRRRRLRVFGGRRAGGPGQQQVWPGLLVGALPGLAAVAAVLFTWMSVGQTQEELRISREAQITGRYTAAVASLGSDSADVRVGGIYALERIMRDSPRDQATGLSVIAAYVRAHARLPVGQVHDAGVAQPLPVDLQAAVTVLANRPVDVTDTTRLQLRYVSLRGLADMGDLDRARQDLHEQRYEDLVLRSPAYRANLLRADLTGSDLRDASLVHAGLGEALLSGADLRGADLRETDFTGAVLRGADLRGANLAVAGFSGNDMRGVRLADVRAQRAFFSRADLRGVDLRGADLHGAYLDRADLRGADLRGADMSEADLSGSRLAGSKREGAKLAGANLQGVQLEEEGTVVPQVG